MKQPRCSRCKRILKDPFSIAVGMGPECRGTLQRQGWKFPKPQFKINGGKVELVGVVGKIERPSVNEGALPKAQKRKAQDAGEK